MIRCARDVMKLDRNAKQSSPVWVTSTPDRIHPGLARQRPRYGNVEDREVALRRSDPAKLSAIVATYGLTGGEPLLELVENQELSGGATRDLPQEVSGTGDHYELRCDRVIASRYRIPCRIKEVIQNKVIGAAIVLGTRSPDDQLIRSA